MLTTTNPETGESLGSADEEPDPNIRIQSINKIKSLIIAILDESSDKTKLAQKLLDNTLSSRYLWSEFKELYIAVVFALYNSSHQESQEYWEMARRDCVLLSEAEKIPC